MDNGTSRGSATWTRPLACATTGTRYSFHNELKDGETRPATLLGERLFFKRINGKVYGVADRCLHRGVPFSPRPECYTTHTLTCWFHGFTYDWRDGKLVEILSEAQYALIDKVGLKVYPTFEQHQVIFVWIGDSAPVDIHKKDLQPRFWDDHLVTHPVVRYKIKCNWRVAAENGFDAAHIYGHRHWTGMQQSGPHPTGLVPIRSRKDIVQMLKEDGKPKGIVKQDDIHVYAREIEGTGDPRTPVAQGRSSRGADRPSCWLGGMLFAMWPPGGGVSQVREAPLRVVRPNRCGSSFLHDFACWLCQD